MLNIYYDNSYLYIIFIWNKKYWIQYINIFQAISKTIDGEQVYVVGTLKHPHFPNFREMHWDMVIIETIVTVM